MSTLQRVGLRRMVPRDPGEPHRPASTLELFFDLTFVVGVSVAAHELLLAEEHGAGQTIAMFLFAFFAVWWGWMNFTWFASAFDTDDWLYRVLTITQMGGVLITAAGIQTVLEHGDFRLGVVGYIVMRLALVAQWLRAARNQDYRRTALRYAGGVTVVQVLWILLLVLPQQWATVGLILLVLLEFMVPAWAERSRMTPFHRRHIAERYGLFTLIVLGEGLLSITNALIEALNAARPGELVLLGGTALIVIAGMWWLYFSRPAPVIEAGFNGIFAFGYLHYLIFGAAAALASGLELSIGLLHGQEAEGSPSDTLSPLQPAIHSAATVPIAVFVLATWWVVLRASLGTRARVAVPVFAVLIGLSAFVPYSLQVSAALVVLTVVVLEVDGRRSAAVEPA